VNFDTTQITVFVTLVLSVAAIGAVLSLGVLAHAVVTHRSERLTRRQSMRTYYGRLAFHH
jgi:hypothetical protein